MFVCSSFLLLYVPLPFSARLYENASMHACLIVTRARRMASQLYEDKVPMMDRNDEEDRMLQLTLETHSSC